MKIISVTIDNFLSIENATVAFDENGLLLIEGYNYDVDRANGAGKTAILNALSFGLYDKIPRKVTASELLRRGAKKGSVQVIVSSNSEKLSVVRSRPKGVKFYRYENEEPVELNITQEEWEKKLRLTYNQFIVSMYCSQASTAISPRFLLLNDADKKQFLLQLLELDHFSACKKRVDEGIDRLLGEISLASNNITNLQAKIDAFSESLVDEESLRLELAEKEEARKFLLKSLQVQEAVPRPDLAKFQKLEDDIQSKKTGFTKLHAQRELLMLQWNTLGRKIRPFNAADTCPTCGSTLDNTHARSVHDAEMKKLQEERLSVKREIDTLDTSLLNEVKVNDLAVKLKEKKRKESADFERAVSQKADLNAKIQGLVGFIGGLNKRLNEHKTIVDKIDGLRKQQATFQDKISTLSQDLELQKTVSAIYSPTGAQAYVLDSAVALFNEQMSKYVGVLWSNLTYELQSYKETVRGDVTAKFSELITMDGRSISLGSLSGGELRALSICADMALLGLLEQQFGIHMSPVIFDEAFDGLDASGKEFALDLIRELAQDRQVVVIDHASEMRAAFNKVLRVEKRNGVSTVAAI